MKSNQYRPIECLRPALILLLAVLLAACGLRETTPDERDIRNPAGPRVTQDDETGPVDLDEEEGDDEDQFEGTELFPGTGVFIDEEAAARRPEPAAEEGEITLNFEGQGIQEVVHAILGETLQENYVIAPGVGGEVTFSTARPVARDQLMPILEMLLRWNNATLIWRENRFQVLPVSEAVRGNLVPRRAGADSARGYEVLAVPLQYISPPKMAEILEPYVREDAILQADAARGLLFLAGTSAELRNYLQIVRTFDVDWLEGMSVGIFELRRVEVADIVAELESVFGAEGETPLAGMFRFVPVERLNSVMVITPNQEYLEEAEKWIERLDRSSPEAGSRLYVYRVKNLDADILAGYLGDLFGTGGGQRRSRRQDRGELAPGLERAQASSVSEFQQSQGGDTDTSDTRRQATGGLTLGEDGEVRVTAVLETNSLLIQAPPSQYDAILNAIERLDEEPLQVLIEAQVLIVDLTDELQYGVAWYLANRGPNDGGPEVPDGFSSSRGNDSFAFGSGQGDVLGTITRRGMGHTFVTSTIQALESISNVRTLQSPSLMVRNNSEARINVGEQIPVRSSGFTSVGDQERFSTQYLNTGVILEVTPRVNPGGLVYLNVRQEVSSRGATLEGSGGNPAINNREVSTEVAVQSGQTIVLGGLIRDEESDSRSGVPFLQRIPGLGALFRGTSRESSRTETLVIITPTVVESTRQLEEVSREFERQFRGLEPLRSNRFLPDDDSED